MRQRQQRRKTNSADIYRRGKVGENEIGEPVYGWVLANGDVRCMFDDESTEFVREDSGERVQTPASVTFAFDADVEESDRINVAGDWYSVTGTNPTRDHRRSTIVSVEAGLEESDALDDADIVED